MVEDIQVARKKVVFTMQLYRASTSFPIGKSGQRHLALFSVGRSRFSPDEVIDLQNRAKLKVLREYAQELFQEDDIAPIKSFFLQKHEAEVQFYEVPLPIKYYLDKDHGRELSSLRTYYRNRIFLSGFHKGLWFMEFGLQLPGHRKVLGYYNDL